MSQVDNLLPDHIKSSMSDAEIDSDGEINMDKVPFARNTIKMDLKQIDKSLKAMNAQNKENLVLEKSDENQNRTCTPVNENEGTGQPLTPTANLKVLFNAMSPELRHRDEQKRETSDEESPSNSQEYQFETIIELTSSQDMDPSKFSSRKEKSLGLLCQKFLSKYPEYPKPTDKYEICLDAVAKELQVERRRIYDIVNVLESVEIVSRVAKNKYAWHGKSNLSTTLAKLKALGDSEGFGEQIQKLKNYEFYRELEEQMGTSDMSNKVAEPDFTVFGENSLFNQAALRKDKSLGIMSQKFLMLFLVSKPKTVNLDMSAKLLIGDANIDKTENSKFKTKIRRLYDIANILTSLDLIRKVHVTEIRGRKPAFKYVGPDIDAGEELQTMACCSDGCHRPISRHSLLDCIQNQSVAKIMNTYKSIKPGGRVLPNGSCSDEGTCKDDTALKFPRHSSFEQLCAVAAVETDRMKASSEPASPVKLEKNPECYQATSPMRSEAKKNVMLQTRDGKVQKVITFEGKPSSPGGVNMPTKGFVRKKVPSATAKVQPVLKSPTAVPAGGTKVGGPEAIIIRNAGKKQGQTVIPLTKQQIESVLRSLNCPVKVTETDVAASTSSTAKPMEVEGSTVDGISALKTEGMKELNEKTPVGSVPTPEKCLSKRPLNAHDFIPAEKRIKLDFPSPRSSDDDRSPLFDQESAAIQRMKRKMSEAKPSPQRALHLAPEFVNASVNSSMTPSGDASKTVKPAVVTIDSGKPQTKKIEIIINESSPTGLSTTTVKSLNVSNAITKQSVLTVPVASVQGQQKPQTITMQLPMTHNMQIVQASPGSGVQQVLQMPCTFNSPIASKNGSPGSGSQVFSYSYPSTKPNTITLTNVQFVQTTCGTGSSTVATLIRPIATKAVLSPHAGSQIVAPQLTSTTLSPVTYLNKSTGGFVPIVTASSSVPKMAAVNDQSGSATVHVSNQLTDISALS